MVYHHVPYFNHAKSIKKKTSLTIKKKTFLYGKSKKNIINH